MPYVDSNGEKRYSLKEKVAYHKYCANTGKGKNGEKLSFTERINHSRAANFCTDKLGRFAKAKEMVNRKF